MASRGGGTYGGGSGARSTGLRGRGKFNPKGSSASSSNKTVVAAAAAAIVGVAAFGAYLWYKSQHDDEDDDDDVAHGGADEAAPAPLFDDAVPAKKKVEVKKVEGDGGVKGEDGEVEEEEEEDAEAEAEAEGDGDLAPIAGAVTRQDLVNILKDMYSRIQSMQVVLKRMMEKGELTDPSEIQREHNNGMAAIEAQVRSKYGISPEQLAAAQEAFAADSEVKQCTQALRSLFEINLPDPGSVPDDLTADKFIEKFRIQIEMTNDVLEEAFLEIKALGLSGPEALDSFRQSILPRLTTVQTESLAKMGLTEEQFTAALLKYQAEDPRVGEMFMQMQASQQMRSQQLLGL